MVRLGGIILTLLAFAAVAFYMGHRLIANIFFWWAVSIFAIIFGFVVLVLSLFLIVVFVEWLFES